MIPLQHLIRLGSGAPIRCCLSKVLIHSLSLASFQRRDLYTEDSLGISQFLTAKKMIQMEYPPKDAEEFMGKLQQQISKRGKKRTIVFRQDLHKAILLSNSSEHLQLVKELTESYYKQNTKGRMNKFKFGPVLIRMCYNLDLPEQALELINNEELSGIFSDASCYQVLMTLLYKHERYTDILDVMSRLRTGQLSDQRYPRSCVATTLAAALKLDTEASQQQGIELAGAAQSSGVHMRRIQALGATIALRAGRPDTALELLHNTPWSSYYTISNLLVSAWVEMGRLEQVLSLMRPMAREETFSASHTSKATVCRDVYSTVDTAMRGSQDPAITQEWRRIQRAIHDRKLLGDKTVRECVLEPVQHYEAMGDRGTTANQNFHRGNLQRYEKVLLARNTSDASYSAGRHRRSLMGIRHESEW